MTSMLPKSVQDTNNLALEKCVKTAFYIDTNDVLLYPLEGVNKKFLSILAKEFHIKGWEGWNFTANEDEKRELLVKSLEKHSKKGSFPSIEEILLDFGIEAKVQEFREYGGRIGHYILKFINLYGRSLTAELEETISKIIKSYAPKSRILDYINYFICSPGLVYISYRTSIIDKTTVRTNGAVIL